MHLSGSVGVSLALVVPSVLGVLYLLLWQSYVLRCATQQESFWGLTLLTVLKPFLTNIKKYSVIEESQRKPKVDLGHVSCIFSNTPTKSDLSEATLFWKWFRSGWRL